MGSGARDLVSDQRICAGVFFFFFCPALVVLCVSALSVWHMSTPQMNIDTSSVAYVKSLEFIEARNCLRYFVFVDIIPRCLEVDPHHFTGIGEIHRKRERRK